MGVNVVELMCFKLVHSNKGTWFREGHAKTVLALHALGPLRFKQLLYRTGISRAELEDVLFDLCKHKLAERRGSSWATRHVFEGLNALMEENSRPFILPIRQTNAKDSLIAAQAFVK